MRTFQQTQLVLGATFLLSLIIMAGVYVAMYATGKISVNDAQNLFVQTVVLYSVPLGMIIGGICGKGLRSKETSPRNAFWASLALALLWNALLLWRVLAFAFADEDLVSSLVSDLTTTSIASMFLVSGALAYFFTKQD